MRWTGIITTLLFLSPAWGLAPRTQLPRDFEVQPFFRLSPERAAQIEQHLPKTPYVVFDFETTDQDPHKAKPIEIAALKFVGTRLVGKFYCLVDPEKPLKPVITQITGLTDERLRGAPKLEEALPRFAKFIEGCELVGHNITSYDVRVLENQLEALGIRYRQRLYLHDTQMLAQKLIARKKVGRFTLESLAREAASPCPPVHSALSDTVAATFLFWHLKELEAQLRTRFSSQLAARRGEILDELEIILQFLQSDNSELAENTDIPLWVLLGNYKLKGMDQVVQHYLRGKCRKVLVMAEGLNHFEDSLRPVTEIYFLQLMRSGIPEEAIELEDGARTIEEKMDRLKNCLSQMKISRGPIVMMGDPYRQKSLLLLWKKLKERGQLPPNLEVRWIPWKRLDSQILKTPGKILLAVQKAVLAIDSLEFQAQQGRITPAQIPQRVRQAYDFLRGVLAEPVNHAVLLMDASV